MWLRRKAKASRGRGICGGDGESLLKKETAANSGLRNMGSIKSAALR